MVRLITIAWCVQITIKFGGNPTWFLSRPAGPWSLQSKSSEGLGDVVLLPWVPMIRRHARHGLDFKPDSRHACGVVWGGQGSWLAGDSEGELLRRGGKFGRGFRLEDGKERLGRKASRGSPGRGARRKEGRHCDDWGRGRRVAARPGGRRGRRNAGGERGRMREIRGGRRIEVSRQALDGRSCALARPWRALDRVRSPAGPASWDASWRGQEREGIITTSEGRRPRADVRLLVEERRANSMGAIIKTSHSVAATAKVFWSPEPLTQVFLSLNASAVKSTSKRKVTETCIDQFAPGKWSLFFPPSHPISLWSSTTAQRVYRRGLWH